MNLVFMGTPEFALPALSALAGSDHNVLAVVTGCDKPSGRGRMLKCSPVRTLADSLKIPVFAPVSLKDSEFQSQMKALNADLFVVIAFRILPKSLYSMPRLGSINIHGSLLPKYRGAAPIQHALLNGDSETGLSAFYLKQAVDTGDIIGQVSQPIEPSDNFTSLSEKLARLCCQFLLETLEKIERGEAQALPQDETEATNAPKTRPADLLIHWDRPAENIRNQIRAFSEKPGAYTVNSAGKRIKILACELGETTSAATSGSVSICGKQVSVSCGDNRNLNVLQAQPEGKRALSAPEIINGQFLRDGERLG